jgi:hypothetical protein
MSDKINVQLIINYDVDGDFYDKQIAMDYNDVMIMLHSQKVVLLDSSDEHNEKYQHYRIDKSVFYYSEETNEKELRLELDLISK